MPCRSDYMEPTHSEREQRKACKNLMWLTKKLGRDVPEGLEDATKHIYGRWQGHDAIIELCGLIREIGEDRLEKIVTNHIRSVRATSIMQFWNEHKAEDRRREKREAANRRNREKQRIAAERKKRIDEFKNLVSGKSLKEIDALLETIKG